MNLLQDETFASSVPPKRAARLTLVEPASKKRAPVACGLASRKREAEELGEEGPISECFACVYAAEERAGYIESEGIQKMMNMIRTSITKVNPIVLCNHVADLYKKIQWDVNRNLMPGQVGLPDWPAASVMKHLREHVNDPSLKYWFRSCELNELIQVSLNASVVVDQDTGRQSIDIQQAKMYLEFIKADETLAKSDLSKKNFYSDGSYLDMKSASSGPVAVGGKNLITYVRSKKKTKV